MKYIFSDKTGTLTRNEMKLRRVVVRGKCYGFGEKHDEVCAKPTMEKKMIHSRARRYMTSRKSKVKRIRRPGAP